ncbi:MAG: NAD-dependent protein deacetylase [Polyangiales bacterium]
MAPLVDLISGRRVAVLTGAGCSTENGIPDYRGRGRLDKARDPIQHRSFVHDPSTRVRYWARSMVGWPRFSNAVPNAAHRSLVGLETRGIVTSLVTQNVDRLHQTAGSRHVIELHGALANVRCLGCGALESRASLQSRLVALNPTFSTSGALEPDGDAEVQSDRLERFAVPTCLQCDGVLKPDVVLFGDNVPRPRVDAAFACIEASDVLLVVGTSLTVFSGFRFVLRAHELKLAIAIVNDGPTRGDAYATVTRAGRAGAVLSALCAALS